MKTREDIITNMCLTFRHDYGIVKEEGPGIAWLQSGMTQSDREHLWGLMAQIFDNDIAPNMDFKQ